MTQHLSNASAQTRRVELSTGVIEVDVHEALMPLDELCGFAARRNPKRGFLFVSKVLGKHIPVRPSLMLAVHEQLAGQVPVDLPGPIVVVGMAETATCLGQGVFEAFKRMSGRDDVVFIHSTRYNLDRTKVLEFKEEHCHAADHIMYLPEMPLDAQMFQQARSIVLVDDEASTGKTFVNLTQAFKQAIPSIERAVTAVITDWRGPERTNATHQAMPVPCIGVAMLKGEYRFQASPNLAAMEMPKATGNGANKDRLLPRNHGRLGTSGLFELPPSVKVFAESGLRRFGGAPVLVLGTGEFSFPPFRLALHMEEMGMDVCFQTTTRSPIIPMPGTAILSAMEFGDNYDDGIANYVYNVTPGMYAGVVIAHETPTRSIDRVLLAELEAFCVEI